MDKRIKIWVWSLVIILIAVVISVGIMFWFYQKNILVTKPSPVLIEKNKNMVGNDRDEHGCIGSAGYTWCDTKQKCLRTWEEPCELTDKIIVATPVKDSTISSPVIVTGKAVGTWFFEGSFPVQVYDAKDKLLGSGQAKFVPQSADDTWMTEGSVSFQGEIKFSQPATDNGYILFKKDNPSGLAQNDESYKLPIKFK
jgi:hypothetical protein